MDTLLVLNASPELEEDLVDFLLQVEGLSGFTAQIVHGHGQSGSLTLAEQVAGRRKRVRVEILLRADEVPALLGELGARVGRDIVWWQQPVSGSGRIA